MDGFLEDDRRNIIYFYGKTQKEAREKTKAYQNLRNSGIDNTVKRTFETWSDFWFEHHKDNITPTTQQNYKYILQTLQDRIGPKRLLDIKAFDIEELLTDADVVRMWSKVSPAKPQGGIEELFWWR